MVVGSPLAAGAGTSLTAETISNTDWVVQWQGQPLCVYHFGPDFKKPYVRAIHTLTGHNILRDSPSDHLHHHALMYGVVVNGVNFWEETTDYGLQKSVKVLEERVGSDDHGRPQASFRHRLAWVAAKPDARPLLYEDRSLTLTVDENPTPDRTSSIGLGLWWYKCHSVLYSGAATFSYLTTFDANFLDLLIFLNVSSYFRSNIFDGKAL